MKHKIRILIIEDSPLYQMYLQRVIAADAVLEVAGVAATAREALELTEVLHPDVITLDLHLPDSQDFHLLRILLKRWKIPILVVTSRPDACEEAIRLGARDFIVKLQDGGRHTSVQFELLLQLKIKTQALSKPHAHRLPALEHSRQNLDAPALIAIGASLGGTEATLQILRQLPEDMPGIIVAQHIQEGYTGAYALRLDRNCALSVKEAQNGDYLQPGLVLVAPAGQQTTVHRTGHGYRVRCRRAAEEDNFSPSVDVLFRSVAETAKDRAVGVILTGMGRDGAEGLRLMHEQGARTLGQNEESCAVYGMPAAAEQAGAVDRLLTPDEIAGMLRRWSEGRA